MMSSDCRGSTHAGGCLVPGESQDSSRGGQERAFVRPVWWCVRAGLRQDWRGLAVLTLITALMGAVALTALAGARRTDTAVARFLQYAGPFQGQVATDLATMDKIAALPDIAYTQRAAMMLAVPVSIDGRPIPALEAGQVITEA